MKKNKSKLLLDAGLCMWITLSFSETPLKHCQIDVQMSTPIQKVKRCLTHASTINLVIIKCSAKPPGGWQLVGLTSHPLTIHRFLRRLKYPAEILVDLIGQWHQILSFRSHKIFSQLGRMKNYWNKHTNKQTKLKKIVLHRMIIFYSCNISTQQFLKAVSISDFYNGSRGYTRNKPLFYLFVRKWNCHFCSKQQCMQFP